jgi:hypothetical protein
MGVVWLLTIVFLYVLILKDLIQNAYMREYWQGGFLPVPPWSDPGWFVKALNENIGIQFGIPYAVFLVFFLMLVGWLVSLRGAAPGGRVEPSAARIVSRPGATTWQSPDNESYALAFAGIFLVTLIASAFGLYPVFERMILFLIPIGLLLIGKAFELIHARLQSYRLRGFLAVLLAGYHLSSLPRKTSSRQNTSSTSARPWKPYASPGRMAMRYTSRTAPCRLSASMPRSMAWKRSHMNLGNATIIKTQRSSLAASNHSKVSRESGFCSPMCTKEMASTREN